MKRQFGASKIAGPPRMLDNLLSAQDVGHRRAIREDYLCRKSSNQQFYIRKAFAYALQRAFSLIGV
jgi:hypothetical protein